MAAPAVRARTVRANDLDFGILEAGSGTLALCLHGFPDSAHTWRHLLPDLADAGCISADLARGAEQFLAPSSRMIVIQDAGHFVHLEKPAEVNDHILGWVS